MTDDLTPDPFDDELRARLHAAADPIDGAGVDRDGVVAAVAAGRRRQVRNRSLVVGAAAAVALLGGIAVATQAGDRGEEQVISAGPATTTTQPCLDPPTTTTVGEVGSGAVSVETSTPAPDTGADGSETTTTLAGAEGETPFEAWAAILRELGLLTPEQEAAIAAGQGISLTGEQSAALQEYWDEQAAGTSTTAPAFAPGPETTTSLVVRCAPDEQDSATTQPLTTTTVAVAPTVTTTTEPTTTTRVDPDDTATGPAAWVVYLYVLSGRRNADGSITPALDRMQEITAGSEPGEMERAQRARDLRGGRTLQEGDLECDGGAAEALGLDPELGQLGISVGFTHKADAQAFADSLPDDLGAFDPVFVPESCAQPRATE